MDSKTKKDAVNESEIEDKFADKQDAKPWHDMIEESKKAFLSWNTKCDNIEKQYANLEKLANTSSDREMQMFWANMEVMKPSIYSNAPIPVVTSRFKNRKPLNTHAAEVAERSLIATFEMDDIDESMKAVRDDLALCGRGQPWVRVKDYSGTDGVCIEHVDRNDFLHSVARKWKEVSWCARRTFETPDDLVARFPKKAKIVKQAAYEARGLGSDDDNKQGDEKAEIWEIWHKDKNVVCWIADGIEEVLEIRRPNLKLAGFFPCPRPAYSTLQPRTLTPVPDFMFVKDQLEEVNELTARISTLSEALKLKGFYAAGSEDVADAIETAMASTSNNALLIPVPSTAALGGAGMDKAIVWMPVDKVATVITQLVGLRKQLIEDVYQITGISDIMRGSTNASETLGAQQLKSQYGSVRIRDKQSEMIRISRDVSRIAGEILCENFSTDELATLSQYDEVPRQAEVDAQIEQIASQMEQAAANPQLMRQAEENPEEAKKLMAQAQQKLEQLEKQITFEDVADFLRNEKLRPFILDIETDSTIQPDENAAKKSVTEFMSALAPALQQLAPMISAEPATAQFAGDVLKFAVSPFRAGRQLDSTIDELIEGMKKKSGEQKPNPAELAAKADQEAKQAEMQLEQQKAKSDSQIKQLELQIKQAEGTAKIQLEQQKLKLEQDRLLMDRQAMFYEANSQRQQNDGGAAQNQALISRMEQSDARITEVLSIVNENQSAIASALATIGQGLQANTNGVV